MNPLNYIGIALRVAGVALIAALCLWTFNAVKQLGVDQQIIVDAVEFKRLNDERAQQKLDAAKEMTKAQAEIVAIMKERDNLKTQLEKNYADSKTKNRNTFDGLSGVGLRFTPTTAACAGRGDSSAGTSGTTGNPTSVSTPAEVQLPEVLTASLRRLQLAGDDLITEYAKCYGWANRGQVPVTP